MDALRDAVLAISILELSDLTEANKTAYFRCNRNSIAISRAVNVRGETHRVSSIT